MQKYPSNTDLGQFSKGLTVIRKSAILVDATYGLCEDHNVAGIFQHGIIRIGTAQQLTIAGYAVFGSLDSIEIKVEPLYAPQAVETDFTGLVCEQYVADPLTAALEITHASDVFYPWMVGQWIYISAGTNFTKGFYEIVAFNTTKSVTLDRTPSDGVGAGESGAAKLFPEFQECAQSTASGVTGLQKHVHQMLAADGDGPFSFTTPLPAFPFARIYAQGTGTAAGSNLWLAFAPMPAGGV